ncbi:MAG: hypothetical protein WC954_00730 [Sphaerochaeta sp.]
MKARALGVIILLLLLGGVAFSAEEARILIISCSTEAEALSERLATVLADVAPSLHYTARREELLLHDIRETQTRTALIEQARSYQQKKVAVPTTEIHTVEFPLPINYRSIKYDPTLLPVLEDPSALAWFLEQEKAVMVLLVTTTSFGQTTRVEIRLIERGETAAFLLVDELLLSGQEDELIPRVSGELLGRVTNDEEVLLRVIGSKEITIPSLRYIEALDLFVIPQDIEFMTVQRAGYEAATLPIHSELRSVTTITPDLVKIEYPPVTLLSNVGAVTYAVGEEVGESSMITLGSPSYPFILAAEKEGFLPTIVPITHQEGSIIRFDLRRKGSDLLTEQKKLYNRALATIISFGSYVVANALVKTYDREYQNPLWSLTLLTTRLSSIISSVALMAELSSYASGVGMIEK